MVINKKRFQYSNQSGDNTYFTAFFADCDHTLEPVTSGYRLVLAYNLIRKNNTMTIPEPINVGNISAELYTAIQQCLDDETGPDKLVYPLEHMYSQSNFNFDSLKGNDRKLVNTLLACSDSNVEPKFQVYI